MFELKSNRRLTSLLLAVFLLMGLAPSMAFASQLAADQSLTSIQATSSQPLCISLGSTVTGYASSNNSQWYSFTTTGGHSAYSIELTSITNGQRVKWNLYDDFGKSLAKSETQSRATKTILLSADTSYSLQITNSKGAEFAVCVSEVPSNPQYQALGDDKNDPHKLVLGVDANSQFDDRGGRQDQWYEFDTSDRHSSYWINLFSRMNNQRVSWSLYDHNGNRLAGGETRTTATKKVLLSANSTYRLKLYASYSANAGYPSYRLNVSEVPSAPQYKALGDDKNNPYVVKLGKVVSSQFDDESGRQDQWFKCTTDSGGMPYVLKLVNKAKDKSVNVSVYDSYGKSIAHSSTKTVMTKTVAMERNRTYFVKVSGSYDGSSGYSSYQLMVKHLALGKVSGLKLKAKNRGVVVNYGQSTNATGYQIAYKKARDRKWNFIMTRSKSYTRNGMAAHTKYQVKVRSACLFNGKYYYGSWTPVKSVTTRA